MQIKLLTLGITTLAMVGWAQSNQYPSQNQRQRQDQTQTDQNQSQGRSQTQTDQNQTQDRSQTQTDTSQTANTGKSTDTKTAEKTMPTKTYKGMLVDASCNPGAAQGSTATPSGSANRSTNDQTTTTGKSNDQTSTTGKSAGMSHVKSEWQSCPATASTTNFGLVLPDGRMVKFDDVGNSRAASEIKSNSKWTSGNKPASVKVRGALEGEKLIVTDIH